MRMGPMVEGLDPYENIPTTTAKGVEFIKQQAKEEKPFFLYFASHCTTIFHTELPEGLKIVKMGI